MASENRHFIFTTLAEYQTVFWIEIADELLRHGHTVSFLSFDDVSADQLRDRGYQTFAPEGAQRDQIIDESARSATFMKYGIADPEFWLTHERVTFGLRDTALLESKLAAYLGLADEACHAALDSGREVTLVQEVGGFLSVVAAYFAARASGIDNIFIEPAFFRGRVFLTRNSFAAPVIRSAGEGASIPEVAAYIDQTLSIKSIVIPKKDSHHYSNPLSKIVNLKNIRRLFSKSYERYVRGKRHEFGFIGRHVFIHIRMAWNAFRLRRFYSSIPNDRPYIYFPFHVPADMALTVRSPMYLDQIALVDFMCRTLPRGYLLAVKEHPAMIGALPSGALRVLLGRYDKLKLLSPAVNNYDALGSASAVVSVNSKSGAEALLLGVPVVVLGDAFYRHSNLTDAVANLAELPHAVSKALNSRRDTSARHVAEYLEQVWRSSYPGELYVNEAKNISAFASALIEKVRTSA